MHRGDCNRLHILSITPITVQRGNHALAPHTECRRVLGATQAVQPGPLRTDTLAKAQRFQCFRQESALDQRGSTLTFNSQRTMTRIHRLRMRNHLVR